jgi:hypothetical protein
MRLPVLEQILVGAVFAGSAARSIVVMTDLETRQADRPLLAHAVGFFIGLVDGHNLIVAVNDDERMLVTVHQGLQFKASGNLLVG